MTFRPTLFLVATLAAGSLLLGADTAKKDAPKTMIGSTVFHWDKLEVRKSAKGEGRAVANNPTSTLATFECHITTLNPGAESHPPHRHATEELILLKEGTLEVNINGHKQVAGPGSTLFYASNDEHNVRNIGDGPATYWVVNLETAATRDPAQHNKSPKLQSAVYEYKNLTVKPSKVGEGRAVMSGSTPTLTNLETHITKVNVGEAPHAAHRHPDDEVVLIREGTLEVNINGHTERAETGSILFFSSNDLHGMRNVGTTPAQYHVVRIVTAATPKAEPAAKK